MTPFYILLITLLLCALVITSGLFIWLYEEFKDDEEWW